MSKSYVFIPKDEYDRLSKIEQRLISFFEHQRATYAQTMQCQMAQQAINVVSQQIR